jgi:hypothetical protein
MKNLLFVLLSFAVTSTALAQNVPNAGFENWTPYVTGEYPDNWTTSDSITVSYNGGNSVFHGTDAYEGAKCMHLKSTEITFILFPIKGPGFATNGKINLVGANFEFSGGSPDTARSRYFTGYYKYNPLGADEVGKVTVYLLHRNGANRDTIATGVSLFTDTVNTYTQFVTEMQYKNYIIQPDTCLIIIQSSIAVNDPSIVVGTELIVDSLGFNGFVGINELNDIINNVSVYPSPASNEINIDVELKKNTSLAYQIFDMNSRLLLSSSMNTLKEKVDISNLAHGRYVLRLNDSEKKILYSTNFTVAR